VRDQNSNFFSNNHPLLPNNNTNNNNNNNNNKTYKISQGKTILKNSCKTKSSKENICASEKKFIHYKRRTGKNL